MAQRTCTIEDCERGLYAKGMCKPCYRKDYYQRNRAHELATMRAWAAANTEHNRVRFAAYSEQRWGAERRARAVALAERLAAPEKACTRCGVVKPNDDFYPDPGRLDGLYSWCKGCFTKHCRDTRDPVADAARNAAYRVTPEGRVKGLSRTGRYRARKAATQTEPVDFAAILARDGMWCYLCETDIPSLDDLHFDHVRPLSKGGPHTEANIRPTHALCNQRKGARLIT